MSVLAGRGVSPVPRVFVDADVLFAGAATPNERSASQLVLRLAELGFLDAVASAQAVAEGERNLRAKLPPDRAALAVGLFGRITAAALRVAADPTPHEVAAHVGKADPKDLPLLVVAVRERCPLLVTFNGRHFVPGDPSVEVLDPGVLVRRARGLLAGLVRGA